MFYFPKPHSVFVCLGLVLFSTLSDEALGHAQTPAPSYLIAAKPPQVGRPGMGRAQGDKNERCPATRELPPLTALVREIPLPASDPTAEKKSSVTGITTSESPTLWFFVPYTRANNLQVAFSLNDSTGQRVGARRIALGEQPGIIGVQMPKTVSLKPNAAYQWFFQIFCGDKPQEVIGWIERVSASSSSASTEFSYDKLNQLVEQQLGQRNNTKANDKLNQALDELGWSDLKNQPVLLKQ
jgi:hypothetical protein